VTLFTRTMTSRVWVSFNSDTVVSTTSETPFSVGNPSFGAHRLTHRMRLILFALFLLTGMSVAIAGQVVVNGTFIYLAFYFPGIIVSLIGTGFFTKFIEQKKLMFKPVRVALTIAFLVLMVTHAAVNVGNAVYTARNFGISILVLNVFSIISLVLVYLTLLMYSLSYISSIYAFLLKSFKAT